MLTKGSNFILIASPLISTVRSEAKPIGRNKDT